MRIFDTHCDALYKLQKDKKNDFTRTDGMQVNAPALKAGGVAVQVFAIFVSDGFHPSMLFEAALAQAELFHQQVIEKAGLVQVKSQADLVQLQPNEIGVILALEGCDCLQDDLLRLHTLLQLGVRSVGLTWNHANSVADGIGEPRGGGLTQFGKEVVKVLNEHRVWCDVSHLSEKGFWEVMELADYPIASHSNAKALAPHQRNLTDEQFGALMHRGGVTGINFVPEFLNGTDQATIDDVLRHVEHFCALGGENHLGFGSDFDGTEELPDGLSGSKDYPNLIEAMLKFYPETVVEKILYRNFARILQ